MLDIHLRRTRLTILFAVLAISVVGLGFLPEVQLSNYHQFVDQHQIFGIPHAVNVLTNLLFVGVGVYGIRYLLRHPLTKLCAHKGEQLGFWLIFVGAVLLGLGAAYYHLAPSDSRFIWDRLPSLLIVMGLLAVVICDRVHPKWGYWSLPLTLLIGFLAVAYWQYTASLGHADIRFYLWTEDMPVVLVTLIMFLFPSRYSGTKYLWRALVLYLLSRVGEIADRPVYLFTNSTISGHAFKHILAAAAIYCLLCYLQYRRCYEHAL